VASFALGQGYVYVVRDNALLVASDGSENWNTLLSSGVYEVGAVNGQVLAMEQGTPPSPGVYAQQPFLAKFDGQHVSAVWTMSDVTHNSMLQKADQLYRYWMWQDTVKTLWSNPELSELYHQESRSPGSTSLWTDPSLAGWVGGGFGQPSPIPPRGTGSSSSDPNQDGSSNSIWDIILPWDWF
jgi:hypothetical protein